MHKCLKCGKEFEGKFCPECGAKWVDPDVCPKCGARRGPKDKFCQECGTRLDGKVNCPNCGALLEEKAAFCTECGAKLGGNGGPAKVKAATNREETRGKVKSYIALSGIICILLSALMGLVFAFVSGVTLVDAEDGSSTNMLYTYFGDVYKDMEDLGDGINAAFGWSEMGVAREFALYFHAVLGTVVSAVGLLGVVALTGLTAFKAYKKFYKKEEANVVAPAVATYFTFVTMATVLLALMAMNSGGVETKFSAPTLAGLITGGVLLGLGVLLLAGTNYKEFKGFNASVGAISSIAVCALAVVIIALASLPAVTLKVSSLFLSSKMSYGLMVESWTFVPLVESDDAIMKIIAFAAIGGVAGIALAVVCGVTLFRKVPAVCNGKNKSNIILAAVAVGLAVVQLVFAILSVEAVIDAMYDDAVADKISRIYAVPIAILVLTVVAFGAELAGKFIRKKDELVQEPVAEEAAAE